MSQNPPTPQTTGPLVLGCVIVQVDWKPCFVHSTPQLDVGCMYRTLTVAAAGGFTNIPPICRPAVVAVACRNTISRRPRCNHTFTMIRRTIQCKLQALIPRLNCRCCHVGGRPVVCNRRSRWARLGLLPQPLQQRLVKGPADRPDVTLRRTSAELRSNSCFQDLVGLVAKHVQNLPCSTVGSVGIVAFEMLGASNHVQLAVDELNLTHVCHSYDGGESNHLLPATYRCSSCFLPNFIQTRSLHLCFGLPLRASGLTPAPNALDLNCCPLQRMSVVLIVMDASPPQPRHNRPRIKHPAFHFGVSLEMRCTEIPCSQNASLPLESDRHRLDCLLVLIAVRLLHMRVFLHNRHQPHLGAAEATLAPQRARTAYAVVVVAPGDEASIGQHISAGIWADVAQ
mmetsp:Transcript_64288/g.172081  ORF Transcript_64288/g.172081 Transcript_64288/m.172081 type:complete len:397 (-) Transcript_64288:1234-2424(-)